MPVNAHCGFRIQRQSRRDDRTTYKAGEKRGPGIYCLDVLLFRGRSECADHIADGRLRGVISPMKFERSSRGIVIHPGIVRSCLESKMLIPVWYQGMSCERGYGLRVEPAKVF